MRDNRQVVCGFENKQFGIFDLSETKEKLGFYPQDTSDR